MQTDIEKEYLLKAFNIFRKKCIVVSPDFKILAVNNHASEINDDGITGRLCYEVFHNRSTPCSGCPAKEVLRTNEAAVKTNKRDAIDIEKETCLYSYPILSGKQVEALVMLDFELPILEILEEKLERSNAFFLNLIHSSIDGVIASDMNGKIIIFNDAASKISGYSIDEALTELNIKNLYPGNGAMDVMKKLRSDDFGGKGKLKSYSIDYLRKNGEIILINLNAAIVYEDGKEVASIGFFQDLREKLRMEKELEKTQTQLLQAEKMSSLGKLAAGVAHQLNNPLGGITLFTKLILEEYELEEALKEDLLRILKDAERCRDTVKELLEFSRQTSQFMRPHDINTAISRTLFLLENQTLFQNIEIEKNLASPLPQVHADIQQLNHLFMNIILNAADAMGGKGKLMVRTLKIPDRDRICIEIADTGPGIPEDVLPHIFEPFFTTKQEGKGTGLGLSMAYSIVENHGGTINAQSKTGKGTTFVIELPLAEQDG